MQKKVFLLIILISALTISGCGKSSAEKKQEEQIKNYVDNTKNIMENVNTKEFQELSQKAQAGDQEAMGKMMENAMQMAGKMELSEYENLKSVDAPKDFPAELVYKNGKIFETEDDGDQNSVYLTVSIKTTDEAEAIRKFYKDLFSKEDWKITKEKNGSEQITINAENLKTKLQAYVNVNINNLSTIQEIDVRLSGDKQ